MVTTHELIGMLANGKKLVQTDVEIGGESGTSLSGGAFSVTIDPLVNAEFVFVTYKKEPEAVESP